MKFFFLCILVFSQFAFSADPTANIFQREQRTFHCERYKTLLSSFDELNKEEIKQRIDDEITGYTLLLKSETLSYQEKRIYKENRAVLKRLGRYLEMKSGPREFNEDFCQVAETAVIGLVKGLGWGANGIMSVASIPFQAVWKFGRAAVTGEKNEGPGDSQYDFLGPKIYGGTATNLLFSQRYLGLALSHPWILPLIAAPYVDSRIMNMCKKKNSLRPEEERYCGKYTGFKTTMARLSEPAEDAGEWIHRLVVGKNKTDVQNVAPYTEGEILKDLTKLTNDNFCDQMVKIGEKYRASRKEISANANRETWRLGTYPERYGIPAIAEFSSSKDNLLLTPSGKVEKLRNVVISLGPAEWQLRGVDKKEALRSYKKKYKEFKRQAKAGRKIFQDSDTVADCEKLARKYKFNYESFENLATEIEEDQVGKKLYEHDVIKGQFKSKAMPYILTGGTKLKWELIENGDISSIHALLRSPDVANVIMVIHGTGKGKIVDSQSNEIPRTFFQNLSPSIMSLNFFSCFSQKIDDYYGLSREFNSSRTQHALRFLSFVEEDETYSYKAGQVPLLSFAGYLSQVDLYMYHALRGNLLYQNVASGIAASPQNQQCKLNVENLGNTKVTYSMTINNVPVGALTPDKTKTEFTFNCSVLKESENKLRFLDIQLEHDEAIDMSRVQISIVRPSGVTLMDAEDLTVTRLKGNVLGFQGQFE